MAIPHSAANHAAVSARQSPVLITGGAGFIGTHLAHRLLSAGQRVVIFDNLSHPGAGDNARWLCAMHGTHVQVRIVDIRNATALREAIQQASWVFHLAAQVAVTTSRLDPMQDFEINAQGTVNVLEALRRLQQPPPLVFASTNKIYGKLEALELRKLATRYEPSSRAIRLAGIHEEYPLAFHSPYACSKGAADQYVMDYARSYSLPAVVLRMSCVYGPRQYGTEDDGWVAHFLSRTLAREPITLYGNGLQVRDVLCVEDLVDALLLAQANIPRLVGQAFNLGGGVANTVSLLELLEVIAALHGERPAIRFATWRPGDQKYYVSDIRRFQDATGWVPRVGVQQGLEALYSWLLQTHGGGVEQRLAV